jgi:ArsR family transcriptional regulator
MEKRILSCMDINVVDFLKQLSDQTRLRSLILLHREGELCVCELTHALGLSQPKVSRHLAHLRDSGIVESRREGIWVYYSLHQSLPDWSLNILDSSLLAAEGVEPFVSDHASLCSMANRPIATCCA